MFASFCPSTWSLVCLWLSYYQRASVVARKMACLQEQSASSEARVWVLKQSYVLRTQNLFEHSAHTLITLSYASLQCCFNYKMLTKLMAKFFLQKDSSKYLLFHKLTYLCRNDMILPF